MSTRIVQVISKSIHFFCVAVVLAGCPVSKDCVVKFNVQGHVTDSTDTPLTDVEVYVKTQYGTESFLTKTDVNGDYKIFLGAYSDLGKSYLIFKKSGFQEADTAASPLGRGNGSCADQFIVRNAVLVP